MTTIEGRTITSPGGDELTVYDDDDFADVLGFASLRQRGQMMQWSTLRRHVLGALFYGGPMLDPVSGRAATKLLDRAIERGLPADTNRFATTSLMQSPAMSLCIERETRGTARRTFAVQLVALPESWYRKLLDDSSPDDALPTSAELGGGSSDEAGGSTTELDEPFPPRSVEPVVPEPDPDPPRPILEIEIAHSVATAMLTQVVEIISAGTSDSPLLPALRAEITELEDRLGHQVGYADKLRRQLRDAGDEIVALKHERDGLRQRLRSAEHNLKVATSADAQRIIDVEVRRQLDRMMRQAPNGQHAKAVATG